MLAGRKGQMHWLIILVLIAIIIGLWYAPSLTKATLHSINGYVTGFIK